MTAVVSTRCRKCRAELRDSFSRKLGYGPECRKSMTSAQLADALRANQPGYIPQAAPPVSSEARRNQVEVQRVTAPIVAAKRCEHDGIPNQCPLCRRNADPWRCAERIIALVQRKREAERSQAYADWLATRAPQPEQETA